MTHEPVLWCPECDWDSRSWPDEEEPHYEGCKGGTLIDLVAVYEKHRAFVTEAQRIMTGPLTTPGSWATMCAAFVNDVALEAERAES